MKKYFINHLLLSACLLAVISAFGQSPYIPYEWEENRKMFEQKEEYADVSLYAIAQNIQYQYAYDEVTSDFICYKTTHKIYKVNNDEAISSTNRIYIPLYSTLELMAVKARAFTPDGRVVLLDEKNIKELEDEESGYRIFAIEGAEVGGEIEFYFTQKTRGNTFGKEVFQQDFPILNYSFKVLSPENLEYEFAVYNDTTTVHQTDTTDQENIYEFYHQSIPALYNESFSAEEASKKYIDFRLSYNSYSGKSRLNTWPAAGKTVWDQVAIRDKADDKALLKIMKMAGITETSGWEGLLKAEHYIKTNYFVDSKTGDISDKLTFISKNKFGSPRGYTRLYVALAQKLGIPYEIVLTCDRFDARIDPKFENWNLLDDFLIYFPKQDQYLSPEAFSFRAGVIPGNMITNYAMFVKPEQVQSFVYPVTSMRQLPEPSYKENFDNLNIQVAFSESLDQNTVTVQREFLGYSAQYYKASLLVLEKDDREKMLEEIVKYLALDADIQSMDVVKNETSYKQWKEPFTIKSVFQTTSYIQKAGNSILFKAGELIGPQSEMYQEQERQTDVVNQYNRGYLRTIEVTIPDGYAIENPDDIQLKKEVKEGDEVIYIFESRYKLSGQKLTIEIDEWYDRVNYPKAQFEPFREVVNAAADWNKVVLILTPKK